MPVDGKALFAIGIGGFFVYGGIKGYSPLKAAQNLITGKNPNTGQSAGLLTAGGSGGSGGSSVNASAPSGPGEDAYFTTLLLTLGAPPTKRNLTSLHNWRVHESPWNNSPPDGAQYTHNPLNTTLVTPSSIGAVNSIGVQIYGSAAGGISATAQTLLGGYPAIVADLRKGVGLANGDPNVASELMKWSNNGYSSV